MLYGWGFVDLVDRVDQKCDAEKREELKKARGPYLLALDRGRDMEQGNKIKIKT